MAWTSHLGKAELLDYGPYRLRGGWPFSYNYPWFRART